MQFLFRFQPLQDFATYDYTDGLTWLKASISAAILRWITLFVRFWR